MKVAFYLAIGPYDEYFTSSRDSYQLIRVKRTWLPDWAWKAIGLIDPSGSWLAHWV